MKSEDEYMEPEEYHAPILAKIANTPVFNVPDSYFESLTQQIHNQVKLQEIIPEQAEFTVPKGYFDNLTEEIHASILLEDLKDSVSTEAGFSVPENYIETSRKRILQKVNPKRQVQVRRLSFIRYAAAACILLTTSLGAYFNVQHVNSIDSQLSKLPADEIENYLKSNTDASDIPMLIENIDGNLELYDFNKAQSN